MSVAASGTGTSAPTPPKTGGPMSVTASGAGTSLPTPPKPGHSSTMPPKSRDLGAGLSAGGSGYMERDRRADPPMRLGDGPPPPPPPTSLPSWAIISGFGKVDAAQDHQQTSGVPTSDPNMNTGGTVPPHASGVPASDQHRHTVGTPPSSSSMREFQGSTPSSNIYREAHVLVPSSGSGQITAVNISGLAGGAQSVRLKSWDEPLRYASVDESKVRKNIQQLLEVCAASNTPPPPEFEARYFASILTGADI